MKLEDLMGTKLDAIIEIPTGQAIVTTDEHGMNRVMVCRNLHVAQPQEAITALKQLHGYALTKPAKRTKLDDYAPAPFIETTVAEDTHPDWDLKPNSSWLDDVKGLVTPKPPVDIEGE